MKNRFKLAALSGIIALGLVVSSSTNAQTVDWGMTGGSIFIGGDFSSIALDGWATAIGVWSLETGFSIVGATSSIGSGDGAPSNQGVFFSSNLISNIAVGTQLYIGIWNGSLIESSQLVGVFTSSSSNWTVPTSLAPTSLDLSDVGVYIPSGAPGFIGVGPNVGNVAVIPEPSSVILLTIGLFVIIMWFRRRPVN